MIPEFLWDGLSAKIRLITHIPNLDRPLLKPLWRGRTLIGNSRTEFVIILEHDKFVISYQN